MEVERRLNMKIPEYLKSTQAMISQAFPDGMDEESYWALIYLLYDHICDENLVLVLSTFVEKPWGVIANDIYKVNRFKIDEKILQKVKAGLDAHGFEEWKKRRVAM